MKFGSSIVGLCLLSSTSSWGFSPVLSSKSSIATTSSLGSTTVEEVTTKALIPPPKLSELTRTSSDEDGATATRELYDQNVQNTYGRYPLTIVSGKGCRLTTSENKEYLDFVSGIATCTLGHANPILAEAIYDQMQTVHHVSNLYYIPAQAALATWLTTNSCADKAFFCNSGAEANEGAIKLARKNAHNNGITQPIIITAKQSFHGRTLAALSATGQPKYHQGFGYGSSDYNMVQGFKYVTYNNAEELEQIVNDIYEKKNEDENETMGLAAIMLEPLQGEGGIIPGEASFFAKARELCDKHNALLICDEVQVGMGRSGMLWGHQQLNVEPDVFTSAKALGGGVPIGAMMAKGVAATVFGPGDHASTYGGNALACRAGITVAEYMSDHNILQNVNDRSQQLKAGLQAIVDKYPTVVSGVRGWGLLLGVVVNIEDFAPGAIVAEAMKEQLLLVPAGSDTVRFVPPLVVTAEDVDEALAKFEKAVATFA